MAQESAIDAPTVDASAATPALDPKEVAEGVLQLVRLAAAHARFGVTFVDSETFAEHPMDEKSLDVLAAVTRLLLKERERQDKKVRDALISRVHGIVSEEFAAVRRGEDADGENDVTIETRLASELGFTLTREQLGVFATNPEDIRESTGASAAAADAVGQALGLATGRSVFKSKQLTKSEKAPLPGQRHGWLPLSAVREYMTKVFAVAEAQRIDAKSLPLAVLRTGEHAEALIGRIERAFRANARRGLDGALAHAREFIRALLWDEDPSDGEALTPLRLDRWRAIRERAAHRGATLRQLDAAASVSADGAARTLMFDDYVNALAEFVVTTLRTSFDVADDSPAVEASRAD
jgi:hypothetical protein